MTPLQRYGGWLLLALGLALVIYGLVDDRDVVVLTGAFVGTFGIVLERIEGQFKVGPQGLEGTLISQTVQGIARDAAEEEGIAAETASRLAQKTGSRLDEILRQVEADVRRGRYVTLEQLRHELEDQRDEERRRERSR